MKQCKILDLDNDVYQGGVLLDDGSVICGCCGGLQPADEKDISWKLVEVYENWINLTPEIIGDDL